MGVFIEIVTILRQDIVIIYQKGEVLGDPTLTSWYLDMGPVPTWSLGGMPLGLCWCPSGIVAAPPRKGAGLSELCKS